MQNVSVNMLVRQPVSSARIGREAKRILMAFMTKSIYQKKKENHHLIQGGPSIRCLPAWVRLMLGPSLSPKRDSPSYNYGQLTNVHGRQNCQFVCLYFASLLKRNLL